MRPFFRPVSWLILLLSLALILVACERPLQDAADLTLEPLAPGDGASPAYPGAGTPIVPGLQATPTVSAEGEGEAPPEGAPTSEGVEAEPTASGPVIHTVVAGDTLGNIANQYGVSVDDIAAANDLANVHTLDVGQQLLIPIGGFVPDDEEEPPAATDEPPAGEEPPPAATQPPAEERVHTVNPGDTLFRIGQQYGFTVDELAAYNNLANPDRLEVGQQIRIPPEGYTIEP